MLAIKVKKEYLDKDVCLKEARQILSDGKIKNMSVLQLAHEIYFHALAFFICDKIFFLRWIKRFADPIDMQDGGDTPLRRVIFAAFWIITKGKI